MHRMQVACVARVPEEADRDRVRLWQYGLPSLPPRLVPVHAVLVADVASSTPGLARVLPSIPGLLQSDGVCVVVLPAAAAAAQEEGGVARRQWPPPEHLTLEVVHEVLSQGGLELVAEDMFMYSTGVAGAMPAAAHATVWRRQGAHDA